MRYLLIIISTADGMGVVITLDYYNYIKYSYYYSKT